MDHNTKMYRDFLQLFRRQSSRFAAGFSVLGIVSAMMIAVNAANPDRYSGQRILYMGILLAVCLVMAGLLTSGLPGRACIWQVERFCTKSGNAGRALRELEQCFQHGFCFGKCRHVDTRYAVYVRGLRVILVDMETVQSATPVKGTAQGLMLTGSKLRVVILPMSYEAARVAAEFLQRSGAGFRIEMEP